MDCFMNSKYLTDNQKCDKTDLFFGITTKCRGLPELTSRHFSVNFGKNQIENTKNSCHSFF